MKAAAFILTALLFACLVFAFTAKKPASVFNVNQYKAQRMQLCSPNWEAVAAWLEETSIPLMPGAGKWKWQITTNSDSAQVYFNQGINMYYGFHIIEAMASFKKAARFDENSPMIWWAQALAYGPNINDVGYAASPEALKAAQKAMELSAAAKPVEKALIEAISVRYSADSTQTREALNQAYVDKMKAAYTRFPAHADVAALYADAMMLQHPWDLWNNDGTPKPWQPQIQQVLEDLLANSPAHPGANHYYIHVIEASPFAAKAMPSADRLGELTPGLSHMVHMPSHIYLRTGRLATGMAVNEAAVKTFIQYQQLFPAAKEGAFLYEWHNRHMQVNCGMLAGRQAYTSEAAKALQKAIDTSMLSLPAPMGSYVQYIYMAPVLTGVRFQQWPQLLNMPKPAPHHVYANVLYHFGRGMAYAATGKLSEAMQEQEQMKAWMQDEVLKIPMSPFSSALEGANVAAELLAGAISIRKNNTGDAVAHFEKAVQTEAAMVYNEPRDWLLNPRPYLGAAYFVTANWQKAEQAFRQDLLVNNNNVWALYGLQQVLLKQNKKAEAAKVAARLQPIGQGVDVPLQVVFF